MKSTNPLPLVSICIPTFNGAQFIAEAMESAILQTYGNLEIVISDDKSKDDTLSIIELYKSKTDIPIYIYHHQPSGIGANWNNCVKFSKGVYIKFLFQDDILEPDCISKMIQIALSNSSIGLVYSKRTIIYKELNNKFKSFIDQYGELHKSWKDLIINEGMVLGKNYLKDVYLLRSPKNKIGEPTAVLIKRECFEKIGYFSEELKQTLDYEYWYRIMKFYNIGFVDKYLVSFRLHNNQATNVNKKKQVSENRLLHHYYYKHLFWQLHFKNKFKLLKLFHPVFVNLVKLKQKVNAK